MGVSIANRWLNGAKKCIRTLNTSHIFFLWTIFLWVSLSISEREYDRKQLDKDRLLGKLEVLHEINPNMTLDTLVHI